MLELTDLATLARADLPTVVTTLGAEGAERTVVTGYQGLTDVDVVVAPGGERIYVRGDEVKLIYLGRAQLPDGVTSDALADLLGTEGELLDSRQGKRAELHVVAEHGIAWSEDGKVGFIEVFPPTDLESYRADIYKQPAPFVR